MKDLQQKHLATLLQGEMSERENNDMQESQNICRICHSLGDEPLITPCHCSGSAKHVHATCLLTWFKKAVKNTCELCRHKVAIKKKGRPYSEVVDMYFLTLIHVCLVHNYNATSTQSETLGRNLSNHNVFWKQKILISFASKQIKLKVQLCNGWKC